jgi:hypothetical protein
MAATYQLYSRYKFINVSLPKRPRKRNGRSPSETATWTRKWLKIKISVFKGGDNDGCGYNIEICIKHPRGGTSIMGAGVPSIFFL